MIPHSMTDHRIKPHAFNPSLPPLARLRTAPPPRPFAVVYRIFVCRLLAAQLRGAIPDVAHSLGVWGAVSLLRRPVHAPTLGALGRGDRPEVVLGLEEAVAAGAPVAGPLGPRVVVPHLQARPPFAVMLRTLLQTVLVGPTARVGESRRHRLAGRLPRWLLVRLMAVVKNGG